MTEEQRIKNADRRARQKSEWRLNPELVRLELEYFTWSRNHDAIWAAFRATGAPLNGQNNTHAAARDARYKEFQDASRALGRTDFTVGITTADELAVYMDQQT
jgi:hypothetical protein